MKLLVIHVSMYGKLYKEYFHDCSREDAEKELADKCSTYHIYQIEEYTRVKNEFPKHD